MDLYGRGYVIEHCVSEYNREKERKNYQIYVTDALKYATEGIYALGGGSLTMKRYADILYPPIEDNRTPNEVIAHMKSKIGGLQREGG